MATKVAGILGKNNLPPVKFLREVPLDVEEGGDGNGAVKAGDRVLVDIFDGEKFVDVVGVSKGKGFQGVVKRHHFGGPEVARLNVSDYRFDWFLGFSIARIQGYAHVGAHGQFARDSA